MAEPGSTTASSGNGFESFQDERYSALGNLRPDRAAARASSDDGSSSTTNSSKKNGDPDSYKKTPVWPMYTSLGADAFFVGYKSVLTGTERFDMVSVPIPRMGNNVYQLDPKQENIYGGALLGVNGFDFLVNDLWLDQKLMPDTYRSNVDVVAEAHTDTESGDAGIIDFVLVTADEAEALPNRTSVSTLNYFGSEIDGVMDPTRDLINAKEIIRNNPDHTALRVGNIGYLSALTLSAGPAINNSIYGLTPISIDVNNYRVTQLEKEVEAALGEDVDSEMVAELLDMYQNSGDFNSHQTLFVYFMSEHGVDLNDTDNPTTAIILGAAADSAIVSPDGTLLAMLNMLEAQAAKKQTQVSLTGSAGIQFNEREMLSGYADWQADLLAGGTAVLLGSGQLLIAKQASADGEIQPLTYASVAGSQALAFGAARFADGDEKLLMANINSSNKFAGAIADPYSVAALSYATDQNYMGDGLANPTTQNLMWLVILGGNAETVLNSGRKAGMYLRQAQTEGDPKKLYPILAQTGALLLTEGMYIYYSQDKRMPKPFEEEYADLQSEYDFEDPFEGNNMNGDLATAGLITLGANVGAVGLGYWQQTRRDKKGTASVSDRLPENSRLADVVRSAQVTGGPAGTQVGVGLSFEF